MAVPKMQTKAEKIQEEEHVEITRKGNPGKPKGEEGTVMLKRMNKSHAPLTAWALSMLEFQEYDTVLDIGCGGGAALSQMSRQILSGHLTGVDYSSVSTALSREVNASEIAAGKIEIVEASVERLPFEDACFDKIITVESFYFWPDPAENLKEVLRVLKKQGIFLLAAEIYQKESLREEAYENIKRFKLFNPTQDEFRALFVNAGFSGVKIYTKEGEDWICVKGVR